MFNTTFTNNEPINSIQGIGGVSILPEYLRSITVPALSPIVSDDLNSVTEVQKSIESDNNPELIED